MHVLVLPSWYSTPEVPWSGTFFENQAVALAQLGARVGVAFVEREACARFRRQPCGARTSRSGARKTGA